MHACSVRVCSEARVLHPNRSAVPRLAGRFVLRQSRFVFTPLCGGAIGLNCVPGRRSGVRSTGGSQRPFNYAIDGHVIHGVYTVAYDALPNGFGWGVWRQVPFWNAAVYA